MRLLTPPPPYTAKTATPLSTSIFLAGFPLGSTDSFSADIGCTPKYVVVVLFREAPASFLQYTVAGAYRFFCFPCLRRKNCFQKMPELDLLIPLSSYQKKVFVEGSIARASSNFACRKPFDFFATRAQDWGAHYFYSPQDEGTGGFSFGII